MQKGANRARSPIPRSTPSAAQIAVLKQRSKTPNPRAPASKSAASSSSSSKRPVSGEAKQSTPSRKLSTTAAPTSTTPARAGRSRTGSAIVPNATAKDESKAHGSGGKKPVPASPAPPANAKARPASGVRRPPHQQGETGTGTGETGERPQETEQEGEYTEGVPVHRTRTVSDGEFLSHGAPAQNGNHNGGGGVSEGHSGAAAPHPGPLVRSRTTSSLDQAKPPSLNLLPRQKSLHTKIQTADKRRLTLERKDFAKEELRVLTLETAEWVANTLSTDYGDNIIAKFWESLQTGVDLCLLIEKVSPPNHIVPCKVNRKAPPGTFFARDNLSNFLACIRRLGVPKICMFEPDDVFSRKNDKNIINCLLQLARVAVKNGVKPPLIVEYELEIDKLIEEDEKRQGEEEVEDEDDDKQHEDMTVAEPESNEPPARYLPYIPKPNNDIDEALAVAVNMNRLDLKIRRGKRYGEYTIGKPPAVHLRLVRKLLLVRVGGGWQGIVNFCRRKLQAEEEERQQLAQDTDPTAATKTAFAQNKDTFQPIESVSLEKQVSHVQAGYEKLDKARPGGGS